ncbi:hypothetical protein [Halobacterium rubrum]|uniref:hypothetical protein n=1 Tax=Halobacterium TaxID=2239 RepID=UPI001F3FB113|nr:MULTISPECIES: hypothetical protein [Halobacterium]MDH5020526.1 hypothetical protein [Halobacterium rubrum]
MSAEPGADVDSDVDSDIETGDGPDISTANTMRERADESRLKLWVVLRANRLVVTGVLALAVFGSFVALGAFIVPDFAGTLESGDTKTSMFATLLGAIVTGTTLVVTISQLVISQENGPLGDQHERMSNTMDFRAFVGDHYDEPAPVDPSAFLRKLVTETEDRAKALRDAVSDNDDDELREEVAEFTDSVTGNADEVGDQLTGATFGTFDVVFAALNFNYGWKIFQVERLAHEHADSIDDETDAVLSELRSTLTMFGPAREHIKTLYFQWALIDLSQLILYAALPALVVAGGMLAFFGTGPIPGTTLGVENVLWVVSAAFTVSLLPFLLVVAYILRIATVAKRTLAIGPIILRRSQR